VLSCPNICLSSHSLNNLPPAGARCKSRNACHFWHTFLVADTLPCGVSKLDLGSGGLRPTRDRLPAPITKRSATVPQAGDTWIKKKLTAVRVDSEWPVVELGVQDWSLQHHLTSIISPGYLSHNWLTIIDSGAMSFTERRGNVGTPRTVTSTNLASIRHACDPTRS
jgi:hypothetical protein